MTQPVDFTAGIKDFSSQKPLVQFRIDTDVFTGVPDLPALALMDFAALAENVGKTSTTDDTRRMFKEMFELVLDEPSAEVFIHRMSDKKRPISIDQVNQIIPWLMGEFGLRPTQPSETSSLSDVIPDGGPSSTDSARPVVLTSLPSLPTDS